MKIQGPNFSNINAYKQSFRSRADVKQEATKQDKINISNEAKQLQVNKQSTAERRQYIEELKQTIQTGQYTINYDQTAQKMIDYWSGRL